MDSLRSSDWLAIAALLISLATFVLTLVRGQRAAALQARLELMEKIDRDGSYRCELVVSNVGNRVARGVDVALLYEGKRQEEDAAEDWIPVAVIHPGQEFRLPCYLHSDDLYGDRRWEAQLRWRTGMRARSIRLWVPPTISTKPLW